MKTRIPIENYLRMFRNQNIYMSGCEKIVKKYEHKIKKLSKNKISFHQNDFDSLKFIKNVLNNFGIKTGEIFLQDKRKCYALYIQSTDGIQKFASLFEPIQKKKRINDLLDVLLPKDTKAGSSRNESQLSLVL